MRQSAVGFCGLSPQGAVGRCVSGDTSLAIPNSEDFALPMHCDDGGSHMRKSFVALLLIGAVAFMTNAAFAQDPQSDPGNKLLNAQSAKERLSRASRLGSSATQPGDTMYVGHTPSAWN